MLSGAARQDFIWACICAICGVVGVLPVPMAQIGFIGNGGVGGRRAGRHAAGELRLADVIGLAGVALAFGFADADDRGEAGAPGGPGFGGDKRVALAVILAALGMTYDDGRGAGVAQHLGTDIAGESAGDFRTTILSADGDRRTSAAAAARAMSVAGGQIRTSQAGDLRPAASAAISESAAARPFIFQFPAIS